jgi:hypothetical protein
VSALNYLVSAIKCEELNVSKSVRYAPLNGPQ